MTTQAATMFLGPLGALREIPSGPEYTVEHERSSNDLVTMGGYRRISRGLRSAREWAVDQHWMTRDEDAYVLACASGAVPGPLYLYTNDAARTNLLHDDLAAPSPWARPALGSVAGTLSVPVAGGPSSTRGVVQQASAGAWSRTTPLRTSTVYVLSAWSSAAGAAIEWRRVYSGGGVASSGTLSTAATEEGFYGAVQIASGSAAGLQVRLAAGSRTVGGLRLVEGVLPSSGPVTRRNLIPNPSFEVDLSGWTINGATLARTTTYPLMWGGLRAGSAIAQADATGSSTIMDMLQDASKSIPVVADQWIAVAALVATDSGVTVRSQVRFTGAATTTLGSPYVPATFYAGTRLVSAFQVPAGATAAQVGIRGYSGSATPLPAGARMWSDAFISATAATEAEALAQVQTYFDGSTAPEPGRYVAWDGPAHGSSSTEYVLTDGVTFPGWAPGRGVPQVVVDDPAETVSAAAACLGAPRRAQAYTLREVGR